ncbi:MAG: serine hydrolase domain-containing protein [Candidatus Dormiibacterota bacterium]
MNPLGPPNSAKAVSASFSDIDEIFRSFAERQRLPGLAYGVTASGGLVHSGAVGLARLQPERQVAVDTVFRIASMTKSITAACVLILRDRGQLRLDDEVATYVPEAATMALPTRDSQPITVRQLLTMSAGLVEDDPWADRQLAMAPDDFSSLLAGVQFSRPPGVAFEYSNLGYALLGRVVANVAGVSVSQFANENLLEPLGMFDTRWEAGMVPSDRRADGHRLRDGKWEVEEPLTDGAFGAMGGLWTTVPDFARYLSFHLEAWPPRDDEDRGPLARASRREMQQPHRPVSVAERRPPGVALAGYGYGLMAGDRRGGGRVVYHSGGLPGFGSHVQALPDLGLGVVGFANLTYAPMWQVVAEAAEFLAQSAAAGSPPPEAFPALDSLRAQVVGLYEQWDDEVVLALAADNLLLDLDLDHRRQEVGVLRGRLGRCLEVGPLEPRGAMRGGWRLRCERGDVRVEVRLAPSRPPRLQALTFTEGDRSEGAAAT